MSTIKLNLEEGQFTPNQDGDAQQLIMRAGHPVWVHSGGSLSFRNTKSLMLACLLSSYVFLIEEPD